MTPTFSVILATRDRPGLFAEALQSVMAQDFPAFEIIVIDDGSTEASLADYGVQWRHAKNDLGDRFAVHSLVRRPKGHGASYAHNYGIGVAKGAFVCFLDDDDKWTDTGHLSRAARAILRMADAGKPLDLYMTNQAAWSNEKQVPGPVWLEALSGVLAERGRRPDKEGCYEVNVADLMAIAGFCHLNCLTARRELIAEVGGMDESIRWEQDRDIYLRLIDQSRHMLHHPAAMSYHRVPDPSKAANITTTLGRIEKLLLQTRVLDKAVLFARNPLIRSHARLHKGYALKKIACELADKQDWISARYYAAQALGATPGVKWLAFTLFCTLRSIIHRDTSV